MKQTRIDFEGVGVYHYVDAWGQPVAELSAAPLGDAVFDAYSYLGNLLETVSANRMKAGTCPVVWTAFGNKPSLLECRRKLLLDQADVWVTEARRQYAKLQDFDKKTLLDNIVYLAKDLAKLDGAQIEQVKAGVAAPSLSQPSTTSATKPSRFTAVTSVIRPAVTPMPRPVPGGAGCPAGWTMTPTGNCMPGTSSEGDLSSIPCPPMTEGTFPDCKPCPEGTIYNISTMHCMSTKCPDGYEGTPPNCKVIGGVQDCPGGMYWDVTQGKCVVQPEAKLPATTGEWSTGAKVAVGAAVVGGLGLIGLAVYKTRKK